MTDNENMGEGEKFYDPETGEQISKNAYKKLQKNALKKPKKEKPLPTDKQEGTEPKKKEKKVIKETKKDEIPVDNTPVGEKKILEGEFPSAYHPKYVESAWQSWWERCGFYKANVQEALSKPYEDKFIMVIPPPNVTGSLHLGHALTNAIEDTITRWNRMKGKVTLWIPGTDHAGIATQSVVERRLQKVINDNRFTTSDIFLDIEIQQEENLTRHDLGREEFVKRVWEWKNTYGNKITNQIRCLGASVDWSR
jgi:valyl-tRNA synthetase